MKDKNTKRPFMIFVLFSLMIIMPMGVGLPFMYLISPHWLREQLLNHIRPLDIMVGWFIGFCLCVAVVLLLKLACSLVENKS